MTVLITYLTTNTLLIGVVVCSRTVTPGSGSGLSNPLFQENGSSRAFIKKDSPSHLIGCPRLIASTSNLHDSRSTFITIVPSDGMEKVRRIFKC